MSRESPLTIVLATNNKHKVQEIRHILNRAKLKVRLLALDDFPSKKPVVENKRTIEGNAIKKAREVAKQTGHLALADDTGLFIKALAGKPGVYSARFAGPACNYLDNNKKVLGMLKGVPLRERKAIFRTIAALATPQGKYFISEGKVSGSISTEMRGENGFGYDPIFCVSRFKKTYAEMNLREKNRASHRARAFRRVPSLLKRALRRES